jgi:hypothetical protein
MTLTVFHELYLVSFTKACERSEKFLLLRIEFGWRVYLESDNQVAATGSTEMVNPFVSESYLITALGTGFNFYLRFTIECFDFGESTENRIVQRDL